MLRKCPVVCVASPTAHDVLYPNLLDQLYWVRLRYCPRYSEARNFSFQHRKCLLLMYIMYNTTVVAVCTLIIPYFLTKRYLLIPAVCRQSMAQKLMQWSPGIITLTISTQALDRSDSYLNSETIQHGCVRVGPAISGLNFGVLLFSLYHLSLDQ